MGKLYLTRHGAASGDDTDDPGLSEQGRQQARALALRVGSSVTQVWHGPSRRTTETASTVAQTLGSAKCTSSELLADRTPVPSAPLLPEYPSYRRKWFAQVPPEERDEDGRALSRAWRQLVRATDADVLLVTHAFVVAWFVTELLDAPAATWLKLVPENASLTVVGADARLELFNDTSHLRAAGS